MKALQIMGILNLTPDSFSDGGAFTDPKKAVAHGRLLVQQGASIIDVGGESTRPQSLPIDFHAEIDRIKDTVEILAKEHFVSIDTFRAETAETCLKLGAKMINDVSALRHSKEMGRIIAEHKAQVVLMYSKQTGDTPHADKSAKDYAEVISEIKSFLSKQIDCALNAGIDRSRIILDPGMGTFISPNPKYSWEVLGKLEILTEYFRDFRILIGTSRKGFLGKDNLDFLSQATSMLALAKGAHIIRTHNVEMASKFCKASGFLNTQATA